MMFECLKDLYGRADQRRALALLHDATMYPGLADLTRAEKTVQLYVVPSFRPMMSWTIYRLPQGTFRVRRVRWDFAADLQVELGEPTIYGTDAECPAEMVSQALGELSRMKIQAFDFSKSLGTDGVTFGFRRESFSQFLEFSWWGYPPAGCEELGEWYDRFTDGLEAMLPAHTDRLRFSASQP